MFACSASLVAQTKVDLISTKGKDTVTTVPYRLFPMTSIKGLAAALAGGGGGSDASKADKSDTIHQVRIWTPSYESRDISIDTSYMRIANGDTIQFFRTRKTITVDSVTVSCQGLSANIKLDFRYSNTMHGAGTTIVNSGAFTSVTSLNVITSFTNASVPIGKIVYIIPSDVTIPSISLVTIFYH